jgi:ribosomal protein S18 acetylase RimI-like enzyme
MTVAGMRPSLEEVLALDLLVLRQPEGGPLDAERHREALATSIPRSEWCVIRRDGLLVAYGYLWPLADHAWFVGGLAIHPDHRNAAITAALGREMSALVKRIGARRLESHVRRDNAASLRLHRRLGFAVMQENDRAIAFSADSAALLARLPA